MKASQQKERLRQAIPVLVVGLLPILLLFFPYLTLTTREVTYQLSALQVLTVKGLEAGGLVATIPDRDRLVCAVPPGGDRLLYGETALVRPGCFCAGGGFSHRGRCSGK